MENVRDFELIQNISELWEKPIILYGAGIIGHEMFGLLMRVGIKVEAFCDQNKDKKSYCGMEVKHADELLEEIKGGTSYNIIVTSELYFEEILQKMQEIKIGNIYTYYGVQCAIAVELGYRKISNKFAQRYIYEIKEKKQKIREDNQRQWVENCLEKMPGVLVFQYGKVGSTALCQSIIDCGISAIQLHKLCNDLENVTISQLSRSYREKVKKAGVKVISVVREPISQFLSALSQDINFSAMLIGAEGNNALEKIKGVTKPNLTYCKEWFHKELEALTGIDVFQHTFNKVDGYSLYKNGKIELLLLTMESLAQNESVIADFIGQEEFELKLANVTENKVNKYLYRGIKEHYRLDENEIESLYQIFPVEHFYTEEDIEKYKKRWTK